MNGFGPHAESGVKNGDVGLVGPCSVKTVDRDVVLCELYGVRLEKSNVSELSTLRLSSLFFAARFGTTGESSSGEIGESAPGVCALDGGLEAPSDSSAIDPLRDFAPIKWFFCLNFSNQLVLFALRWLSELPTVCAKKRALSRIIASVS